MKAKVKEKRVSIKFSEEFSKMMISRLEEALGKEESSKDDAEGEPVFPEPINRHVMKFMGKVG